MSSNLRIGSVADSYGIYTYKDDLIWFLVEDHENWRHREIALRMDGFIKIYIKRLDEELFAEKPICTPDIFGSKEQDEERLSLMNGNNVIEDEESVEDIEEPEVEESETDISEDWEHEKWSHFCSKIMDKSRVHSFSVVSMYDAPPYWRVFCDREIKNIEYNDKDIPIKVKVEWSRELPFSEKWMNYTETITLYTPEMDLMELNEDNSYGLLIPFGTAPSEDKLGEYDLEDKWTYTVRIRYALLDVANNSSKTSGFYQYIWGRLITPEQEAALKSAIDYASSSQGVGAKRDVLEEVVAHYPAKPEFTILALAEFIREFAVTCRLPLKYFRSESEKGSMFGDMTGDDIAINKKKRFIFGQFKPYFITLIFMRWGITLDDIEPFIYESEEEEIEVPMDYEKPKKEEVIK